MNQRDDSVVLSIIQNDEYLLSFWLDHHKNIFKHGIIIDYSSTDSSLQIIKNLCPTWEIICKDTKISHKKMDQDLKEMMGENTLFLYTHEFLIRSNDRNVVEKETLARYTACSMMENYYPPNLREFFNQCYIHRDHDTMEEIYILDCVLYPSNSIMLERLKTYNWLKPVDKHQLCRKDERQKLIFPSNVLYSNLVRSAKWGEDEILLENDIDLLQNTSFKEEGFKIFDIEEMIYQKLLDFFEKKICSLLSKKIVLEKYHESVQDSDHSFILNSMPFKSYEIHEVSEYLEEFVSRVICHKVGIFNDDIWFRICRPSITSDKDFNPCHRDVYLDFYRNVINIYIPLVGSNMHSSLSIQPKSHRWNENETMRTEGGAYFVYEKKKYSVDAIVASRIPINMIRPDPKVGQIMIFSPYLIHGCSSNDNKDLTRISVEIRFIKKDENRRHQEEEYQKYVKNRKWR